MKENSKYLCYDEIHSQYAEMQKTLDYMESERDSVRAFFEGGGDIVFVACGSSYWLSLSAKSTMMLKTNRNAYAVKGGDIILNEKEYAGQFVNPTFICPSRSGSTTEVLEALKILKRHYPQAKLLSLVEYKDSQLEKISDFVLSMSWANEASVCQTRSFSCLYLASILIADALSGGTQIFEAAKKYVKLAPELYRRDIPVLKRIVEENEITKLVCLGSGTQYGVCIEGAYIVIEVAGFASNYFQLLEYRHGPIVITDQSTAVFMVSSEATKKYEEKIFGEIKAYTDRIYLVSAGSSVKAAHQFVLWEGAPDEIVALHFVFCMQSAAFRLALKNGTNPDAPGDLVPFIEL